jgi:hypothetical protein
MRRVGDKGETGVIVEDAAGEVRDRGWTPGARRSAAINWSKS